METPETVIARAQWALPRVPADRLILAGLRREISPPQDVAFDKLTAMTEAAARLRAELA
ncbi:MAG: hypothetical protein ABSA93_18110 [Streptosporangiaceae bacterium]